MPAWRRETLPVINGGFSLREFPAGRYRIRVEAEAAAPLDFGIRELTPEQALHLPVLLRSGGTLAVRVRGTALVVGVRLLDRWPRGERSPDRQWYYFVGLPPGRYPLRVELDPTQGSSIDRVAVVEAGKLTEVVVDVR